MKHVSPEIHSKIPRKNLPYLPPPAGILGNLPECPSITFILLDGKPRLGQGRDIGVGGRDIVIRGH